MARKTRACRVDGEQDGSYVYVLRAAVDGVAPMRGQERGRPIRLVDNRPPAMRGRQNDVAMIHPSADDVVVRQRRSNPHFVYLLGTASAADQFLVHTYDEGVKQACGFAQRRRVRAWFDEGDDTFVLLGTFRNEESARTS